MPKASKEGFYTSYQYMDSGTTIKLRMPPDAGDYELRVLGSASPYPTLARHALKLTAVAATIEAPAQVAAGAKFDVKWTGPNNARDYIGISDGVQKYTKYLYTSDGSPLHFVAPDAPGKYELRYFLSSGDKIIATRAFTVGGVSASVSGPATIGVGAAVKIKWEGPNNERDFISIVKAGTPCRAVRRVCVHVDRQPRRASRPGKRPGTTRFAI